MKTKALEVSGRKRPSVRQISLSEADRMVSRRVADLRRGAGITLRRLAEESGLSDAYLSRVENEQAALTVANLSKLAEVFGIAVASFFESEAKPQPLVITRSGKGNRRRFRGRRGTVVELLADEKVSKLMEPLIVDVAASSPESVPRGHPGEEFNIVLEGKCIFQFGAEEHLLGPGDSVYFDATTPHLLRPEGSEPAKVVAVVTSKDQRYHSDIGRMVADRIQT